MPEIQLRPGRKIHVDYSTVDIQEESDWAPNETSFHGTAYGPKESNKGHEPRPCKRHDRVHSHS